MTSRSLHRCCAALAAGLLAGAACAEPPATAAAGNASAAVRESGCDWQHTRAAACAYSLRIEDAPGLPDDLVPLEAKPAALDFSLKPTPGADRSAPIARFETIDLSAELLDLPFRDREPLVNRLRALQALPFFTLWDSSGATLYVGIDRSGSPGLHLRQKGHTEGPLGLSASDGEPDPETPETQPPGTIKPPSEPARAKTSPAAGRR